MNLSELKKLRKREKELLESLERIKSKEEHELSELKDEVEKLENELKEITRKISVLEPLTVKEPNFLVKFWRFLKEDSWQSWLVSLVLLIVLIRFIFFPILSFATGSSLPLVVIESCSLYHESSFDQWWENNGAWYEERGISKEEFNSFPFHNGLNKGDIIFVWGYSDYDVGDIIIFQPNPESDAAHPIIHRIISEDPYATKGDHNSNQLMLSNNFQMIDETDIPEERIIGKSVFRLPVLGWIKLIFFEPFRTSGERGFCA